MSESRKRSRVPGQFLGSLLCQGREFAMHTINVSLNGVLLCLEEDDDQQPADGFLQEADCEVVIELAEDVLLQVFGKVVRSVEGEMAIEFTAMDEESYTHLRNIVRYGSDDADEIDREQVTPAF